MKNGFLVTLLAAAFLLGMVPLASAGLVVWHVLNDPAVALKGPGPDGVIGVPGCSGTADNDDTTTGENNKCNFTAQACADQTGADPTNGSYSYGALESGMAKSCLGGSNKGKSCVNNDDCPGVGALCIDCAQNPSGFDSYYYAGDIGNPNGNGTMTMCGEGSTYEITSMKIGGSETAPDLGPSCVTLQDGGPYTGSPCGIDQESTSTMNIKTSVLGCVLEAGRVDGLVSTGRAYDVNEASPAPVCGYNTDDILCLLDVAKTSKGAKYLQISCSEKNLPDPLEIACLAGGQTVTVIVAWTTDDASDCVTACEAGGCSASAARSVK